MLKFIKSNSNSSDIAKSSDLSLIVSLNLDDLQIVALEDRLELAECGCCAGCNCAGRRADRVAAG